ncbi:MAG TPA: methyltransferase domain-containing protein [Acidimicrobiales bacterium]|nr:methyltransferase domain-containing protein [Acidimicrobiales bacterium]
MASFDELIAEAEAAPISGWDFSWLDGRASEERPSWRYAELVAVRYGLATRVLDLQSGGGELLAKLPDWPPLLVASEGYPPNVAVAARALRPRGASVVAANDDRPALPFADESFDLVTSRHPIVTWWGEIARVLRPGGTYLSQQVGPHTVRELREFMLGPLPSGTARDPEVARAHAEAAGLVVNDIRLERLRMVFYDVGAVVYFLRLVVWTVPGFTVAGHRDRLEDLHEQIERDGSFVAHATRFLIEATKPG